MTKTSAEDIDSPNPNPTHPIDPGASTETYISAFVAVVDVVIGIANATQTPEEESQASCPLTAFTTIAPHQQPSSTKKGGLYGMQSYSQSSMKTTFRQRGNRLYTRIVRQENVNLQSVRSKKGCDCAGGWRGVDI
jgi:hypothetical protein